MYIEIYINTVLEHQTSRTVFRTLSALAKIPFLANSYQKGNSRVILPFLLHLHLHLPSASFPTLISPTSIIFLLLIFKKSTNQSLIFV